MPDFLENYELANDSIKRFRDEYPSGRLIAIIEDVDLAAGWILIKAEAYREYEDHLPSAVDFAYGNVAFYPANMKKWFVEDTTTSALARVIKLLTPSAARPSREDMQKVETLSPMPDTQDFWATQPQSAGIPTISDAVATVAAGLGGAVVEGKPMCVHGARVWRTGEKNGRNWYNYGCTEKNRAKQCQPIWYDLGSDGTFRVQA